MFEMKLVLTTKVTTFVMYCSVFSNQFSQQHCRLVTFSGNVVVIELLPKESAELRGFGMEQMMLMYR